MGVVLRQVPVGGLLPTVSYESKGLVPNIKSLDNNILRTTAIPGSWIRIVEGTNVINPCSSIVTVSTEWNTTSSRMIVFIITALCRQTSNVTVLHKSNLTNLITKVRVVKAEEKLYIDLFVNPSASSGNNGLNVSFSGSLYLRETNVGIVDAEQPGYTIEEFGL